jgi:periplasmic protein CpxP/Spy
MPFPKPLPRIGADEATHPAITMKLQTALFSSIAALLVLAPIAIPASAAPRQTRIAQSTTTPATARKENRKEDPARKAQWDAKRNEMKAKLDAILTPDQRQQLQSAIVSGLNPRMAMAQLNLSDAQKAQIKAAFPKMAALNLTEAQKTQMMQIAQQTRQQVQSILTPQQQTQLQAAIAQGKSPKDAMKDLGITDAQKTQLRDVKKASKESIFALLTPEQRQQMGGRGEGKGAGQAGRRGAR